jgi:hypothetical protein
MKIVSGESEIKTKTAVGIGRFLTQKLVRAKKIEKLVEHKVHGASFTTLKDNDNDTSNAMLTDIYTRRSDAFYRFTVSSLLEGQTACRHQSTCKDGLVIEKKGTVQDVTEDENKY